MIDGDVHEMESPHQTQSSATARGAYDPTSLATIFAGPRERNGDLSDTLVVTPAEGMAPTMIQPRALRPRGRYPVRPAAIAFDLLFARNGGWRLEAIAVQTVPG